MKNYSLLVFSLSIVNVFFFVGSAIAQNTTTRPESVAKKSAAKQDLQREKLVVAMPKTYGKLETMNLWGGYFNHLSTCAKVDLLNSQGDPLIRSLNVDVLPEKELIDTIKSGKAQLAQVNPGLVPQLMEAGEPAPFAAPGNKGSGKRNSYNLILIARADSTFKQPMDLVGKKIAHSTPTSNSGNLAPRALFPALGLTPGKNYEVVFSGGHERSVVGLGGGFWDAAAVASDLYQRMVVKGDVNAADIRVIWTSPPFMTETWMMSKTVSPALRERVQKCSYKYNFSPDLRKLLSGNDVFLPVNFERDFATVMEVYRKSQESKAQESKAQESKATEGKTTEAPVAEPKPAK
jgi:phosphonate transport system substrate-binding protein